MASPSLRLPDNVPGQFYVDSTCIDCDTCRRVAPSAFAQGDGHSFVAAQPADAETRRRALMALVACPTASIGMIAAPSGIDPLAGAEGDAGLAAAESDARLAAATPSAEVRRAAAPFPERVDENVSFCGYTAESSFGAWSYFVERPQGGNVLVDSPRAAGPLLEELERRGGVATMFLTHRDDVADHEAFRKRFACERVLHAADVTSGTRGVERRLEGEDPVALAPDLLAIPTPGHTRGHAVLLYSERYLFTGDHLAWSARRGHLVAFRDANWYSWPETIRSMERLLDSRIRFEWVLPGHGAWHRTGSADEMRRELEKCVAWMRRVA